MQAPELQSGPRPFEFQNEGPNFNQVKHYQEGLWMKALAFFGRAVKVQDSSTGEVYYVKVDELAKELFKTDRIVQPKTYNILKDRILEISGPDDRMPLSAQKLKKLFDRYSFDKNNNPDLFKSEADVLMEMDKLKIEMSEIPHLFFQGSLAEIISQLKPGDIFVRDYDESHDNIICNLQKFFYSPGWRDSHKCSHLAIYLGEINGKYWIGEASMPHGDEAQIRRIQIDDPRFNLKNKTKYLIFRKKNTEEARESARLASRYTIKLEPEAVRPPTESERETLKYTYFEATRSLFQSPTMGYFARQRLLKYYSDYKNGIPFEYLGNDRAFFCSNFAIVMESLAEMNKSPKFQEFIKKHPIPAKYDDKLTGIRLKISKVWYSIRKGLWSRWFALANTKELKDSVTTHLDLLRTSPKSAVNYMMYHKDQFEVVGLAARESDFAQK